METRHTIVAASVGVLAIGGGAGTAFVDLDAGARRVLEELRRRRVGTPVLILTIERCRSVLEPVHSPGRARHRDTTTWRSSTTAMKTTTKARSIATEPSRSGGSTRRTGASTGSVTV
jgi:hypothetical protein